jgi:superfamily II DNA or RNA helicase
MTLLDFNSLQRLLDDFPDGAIPMKAEDGIFDRLGQILAASQAAARLVCPTDVMALVRHVLRRQSLHTAQPALLAVPASHGWPTREEWEQFGMRAQRGGVGRWLIEARPWRPTWVADPDRPVFEDVFAEHNVRLDWGRPIDPFVGEASQFANYVSPGQREAVRSAILLPPGETLIVGLPTGSGKSFVAQAPMLIGGPEGSLSVCVVPTTALAIDQARQTAKLLRARFPNRNVPPLAWFSGLDEEGRAAIKGAIREGRQRILYCSPEAVTGALLPTLYDCAKSGLLAYLVIDEAHLVSQWGDGFRPAFQMLAGVRRGLLDVCAGSPFKTLLMSATLTPDTVRTIETLFGPARTTRMVASIYLRPEPQYWFHREDDPQKKTQKVLEALRHAPRPFILYVTERRDARRWLSILKAEGYVRLDCFHGETRSADKVAIIDAWSHNRLDGIVATSAFGVGIDKRDVRTIIHAAVPETLDRFYQEVGRGGRDGRCSGAFMIYSAEDRGVASRIASPSLIGEELGYERWDAMYGKAEPLDPTGHLIRVDLSVVPPSLRRQTDYNAAWNMRTLIMMARAGMLNLESEAPERIAQIESEADATLAIRNEEHWGRYFRHVLVRVQEGAHRNKEVFDAIISHERTRSVEAAKVGDAMLDALLDGHVEVSAQLERLYRNHAEGRSVVVSKACGGCPQHRREGGAHTYYAEPAAFGIEQVGQPDTGAWRSHFPHLDLGAPIILALPKDDEEGGVLPVLRDLVALLGVREVGVTRRFRSRNLDTKSLHKHAPDGVLLVQDLEEEEVRGPTSYQLARASVWDAGDRQPIPRFLFGMDRPLHVILVAATTQDPWHPQRRLIDTGANVLSFDQFKSGVRA